MAVVSACATGTHSVGEAAEVIRRGLRRGHRRLDGGAVAGGRPRRLHEHAGMGSPRPGEPAQTLCRPFDLTAQRVRPGEGAGGLLLEDLELAKARGARIYAEVVGYGSAADGWDMVQPIEGGIGSARTMRMALERRGVPADEVDMINPTDVDAARRQTRGGGHLGRVRRARRRSGRRSRSAAPSR